MTSLQQAYESEIVGSGTKYFKAILLSGKEWQACSHGPVWLLPIWWNGTDRKKTAG